MLCTLKHNTARPLPLYQPTSLPSCGKILGKTASWRALGEQHAENRATAGKSCCHLQCLQRLPWEVMPRSQQAMCLTVSQSRGPWLSSLQDVEAESCVSLGCCTTSACTSYHDLHSDTMERHALRLATAVKQVTVSVVEVCAQFCAIVVSLTQPGAVGRYNT